MPNTWHTAACFLLVASEALCISWVLRYAPRAYMDEIFHIPQTQRYCRGDFSWDPMITTPPGLYIFGVLYAHIISWLSGRTLHETCNGSFLRTVNSWFGIGSFLLFHALLNTIHKHKREREPDTLAVVLRAVALHLYPIHFFFHHLYYTDSGSTFFLLLTYYASMKGRHTIAAFFGAISLLFRQTNIIWIAFAMLTSIMRHYTPSHPTPSTIPFSSEILIFFKYCFSNWASLLWQFRGYIIDLISFALFIYFNNGIVLGDRSAHIATLHFPQVFYYICSASLFILPFTLFQLSTLFTTVVWRLFGSIRRMLCTAISLFVVVVLIRQYTFAHPYLLADNRHYTFYIWKNFFRAYPWFQFAMAPVYVFCFTLMWELLGRGGRSQLWRLCYFALTAAVLVPAALFEFRYYIVPFLIFALHIPLQGSRGSVVAIAEYTVINATTIGLFLLRPFAWPSGEEARFMW